MKLFQILREMFFALPRTGILVRVTNMGLGFVLMTLVVAIGATNTGNNGLYLLVSVFFAALVVSGVVSRRNVERLRVSLEGPEEIWAGEPARFTLRLSNEGRLPRRAVLVKIANAAAPVLFSRIDPGGDAARLVDLVFPHRGRRRIESVLVYSGYPIGLFRKGRILRIDEERVVYPAHRPVRVPRPDPRDADAGDPRSRRRGRGFEIRHLREAGFGDDPRDVHWHQTARQGRLIVKERGVEEGRDGLVVVDARPETFEEALSEGASLLMRLLARGDRVGLLLGGRLYPPARGPAHRRTLLLGLALAEPEAAAPRLAGLPRDVVVYRVRGESGRVSEDVA